MRLLKNQLLVSTGLPADTDLTLSDSLTYQSGDALAEKSVIDNRFMQRPELRQLALSIDNSRLQVQLEQARRQPTLGLYGQAGTLSQMNNFQFADSRWPFVSFLGLQLTVPLFNATNAPRIQQARLAEQQAQEQLWYTQTLIANEVRSALYAMEEASERINAQEHVVRAAQRSYTRTESRYREGLTKLNDLTDAELALRQAQTNRLQAIHDYLTAKVNLGQATSANR